VPKVKKTLEKIGMTNVTMILYPEDRHEILNEVDKEKVFADIRGWLEELI